jgi:small nuclear ribonucleoprotein G
LKTCLALILPNAVKLNANRHVTGVLRGFDQFMNIVLDNTVDEKLKADLGMVVRNC